MAATLESDSIRSILDTDLYKLTMQCVVHAFYRHVPVSYNFTNRTPDMKLNRKAFDWLERKIADLEGLSLSTDELRFLRRECKYLNHGAYLEFLQTFRFRPSEHVKLTFVDAGEKDEGELKISIQGLWVDTILYEIPLLALVSEAYFKFVDTDWTYEGQLDNARRKGLELLKNGCVFMEFGTRRRRDYATQDLVMQGLRNAAAESQESVTGIYAGTSNVHLAMKYNVTPLGTVAHEWFMGLAAFTGDYANATSLAMEAWVNCFGMGVLGIALTDTFGTPTFLKSFSNKVPLEQLKGPDSWTSRSEPRYADIFVGVRQDSGDPKEFVKTMRKYYDQLGIKDEKTIVFSDSLDVKKCLQYKSIAEDAGFKTTFGIGTFLTNDFRNSKDVKSVPLNIVIKLSSAGGNPAIKLSDDLGKHTGDGGTVERVKEQLHYVDKHWDGANEATRWNDSQQ